VEAAEHFVRERDKSQPFLMYVSLMAPHDPRTMPREFMEMYPPANVELPDNFLAEHPIDTGALRIRDELLAEFPRDPDEIRRHIAEYYAMISHLDAGFGRLVAALRETGVLDDTIIVFAGDNGLAVGQHGLMGKQNLYEHSVRVPLIMAGPGVAQGQSSEALVYLLDILPTLCDLTGVETPPSVEGRSLRPCLDDTGLPLRDTLYLAYGNSIRGITDGSHKLIEYACGASQLFDLTRDTIEMNNLLDVDGEQARVEEMRQELVALAEEWDDAMHPTGAAFWAERADLKQP
jgi:arylsulfatase A-like enzyme